MHEQVWAKVNVPVDEGIAEIVAILSEVDGLETVDSCQGDPARNDLGQDMPAYVFFYFGDWWTISEFAFGAIAPVLEGIEGAEIRVEIFGGGAPMGKLSVLAPSIPRLAAALKQAIGHMSVSRSTARACDKPRHRAAGHKRVLFGRLPSSRMSVLKAR